MSANNTPAAEAAHQYNGDLGLAPGSADAIRQRFAHDPAVIELLLDNDLNTVFQRFEDRAKGWKRLLRRWGATFLIGAGVGLVVAVIELVAHAMASPAQPWIGVVGGIASVTALGATLGSVWLIFGLKVRKRWLENRFGAERLRLWHFQTLLDEGLVQLARTDMASFKAERARRFGQFLEEQLGQISGTVQNWAAGPHHEEELPPDVAGTARKPVDDELWRAYLWLRLGHQQRHWGAKLARDDSLIRNAFFLKESGQSCFMLAMIVLLCQVVVFGFHVAHWCAGGSLPTWLEPLSVITTGAALFLVVLSVVLRALDEGFGFGREAEHYRNMSLVYLGIVARAKGASDKRSRREIMRDVELWAMTELKDFLLIHIDAKFLL